MADNRRKFTPHPIVGKLETSGAVRLLGYIGGTTNGVVKVHPSLNDLSVFYRIRENDIVDVEAATAEELPNNGSVVWVKAEADIERCVTQSSSVQARFLAGAISAGMAGGPAVAYVRAQRARAGIADTEPVTEAGGCTFGGAGGCTYGGANCTFSVWPCSIVWGACMETAFPCVATQGLCEPYTAESCFTCAGYTCVAQCHSAGCPPTHDCPPTRPRTICACEVYSAFCAR